ncbi:hypothetical protein BaRGS_00012819 [Batillaria attramentaria]|uniref:Uncharacterized protein n=1 Tax=Batillaria attramentaria TaxID=370345 RepID=A0ABD0L8T6_9CAEN
MPEKGTAAATRPQIAGRASRALWGRIPRDTTPAKGDKNRESQSDLAFPVSEFWGFLSGGVSGWRTDCHFNKQTSVPRDYRTAPLVQGKGARK